MPPPRAKEHLRTSIASVWLILLIGSIVLGIWGRNRTVLRDQYDYSIVIAAAGKVEAGYKPYADVPSPMQSSVYLLNYFTEQVFGRDYLGLTWGGLVQALGGGLLLFGLLRRPLGAGGALALALAIVLAGLLQHMVFFYNTVGILCFSVVVLGLAVEPRLWPVRSARAGVILAALCLSGINKVNFHALILVLAVLFTLAAWQRGRLSRLDALRNGLLLIFFGGVLPVSFELAWTGATYGQWLENVVLGPSGYHDYLKRVFSPELYQRPVHDFYANILVPGIGGVGLGLLALTAAWALFPARDRRQVVTGTGLRVALVGFGGMAGAALMLTNHETVLLTSLAYPVIATALFMFYREPGRTADRAMGGVLIAGTLVWVVAGGFAAWHGSRLLYGMNPPSRSAYVAWEPGHRSLEYLRGVRMLPEQIDALRRTAARLATMEDADGRLPDILFGPGLAWFERHYQHAIMRHAPIWLHAGTTLHDRDAGSFFRLLNRGERRLVVSKAWQSWPAPIRDLLERHYVQEPVGSRDLLYLPRPRRLPDTAATSGARPTPAEFREGTASNVLIAATRWSPGMGLRAGPEGSVFGGDRTTNWSWPLGCNALSGRAVAWMEPGVSRAGVVNFRIMADHPDSGQVVWEASVAVGPDAGTGVVPFAVHPGGRPLWLQVIVPPELEGLARAGWRALSITHSNEQDRSPAPPFNAGLQLRSPAGEVGEGDALWYAASDPATGPVDWVRLPLENWRRAGTGRVRVTVEFRPDPANAGEPVVVTLAWYRAGRFEIMTERQIDLRDSPQVTLEAHGTEPGGWIGLLARHGGAAHFMRIVSWEN